MELYFYSTCSSTLMDGHRLRAFEKSVMRKRCGPKKDEVIGKWRRLHNEKLHGLYSSSNIIRVIKSRRVKWAAYVARMEERTGAHRDLVGRSEGKRPLGRHRRR